MFRVLTALKPEKFNFRKDDAENQDQPNCRQTLLCDKSGKVKFNTRTPQHVHGQKSKQKAVPDRDTGQG